MLNSISGSILNGNFKKDHALLVVAAFEEGIVGI